jgi:hypothetical protein
MVDGGGGCGTFLTARLQAHPQARGMLLTSRSMESAHLRATECRAWLSLCAIPLGDV